MLVASLGSRPRSVDVTDEEYGLTASKQSPRHPWREVHQHRDTGPVHLQPSFFGHPGRWSLSHRSPEP